MKTRGFALTESPMRPSWKRQSSSMNERQLMKTYDGPAPASSRRRAFTLMELLVVVAIIAVLAALILPAMKSAKESSNSATCMGNLKSIGAAAMAYAAENNGRLPPICLAGYGSAWSASSDTKWWPSFLASSTTSSAVVVRTTWRCPSVQDADFRSSGNITYGSYAPLKPVIAFLGTEDTPSGSMLLAQIERPSKTWMFGDAGVPRDATGKPNQGYQTTATVERYANSWAGTGRPACRHSGNTLAYFVACDGHVQSLRWEEFQDLNNSVFGYVSNGKVRY